MILVDTSILIDYYRKTDKENSAWIKLVREGYSFAVSVVTKYEIFAGASSGQVTFWEEILQSISIVSLDEATIDTAVTLNNVLKRKRKQIDLADLFIAATAVAHGFKLATLNRKHFDRIDTLNLIE